MSIRILLVTTLWAALFSPLAAAAQGQPLIIPGLCAGGGLTPVCAVKKGTLVTYVNDCAAIQAGARLVSYHACPENCPRRYAPVCGIDSEGRRRTYGTACDAERSGAKIVRNRGCQGLLGRR